MTDVVIDAHVHVGPWLLPGLEGLACTLDEAVLAALEEGIEGVVATRSDGGSNDELGSALAEERRLKVWYAPWVRPGTDDAAACLRETVCRVAALKIHPSIDRTRVSDPGYDEAFSAAEELGVPVIVHTGRWQEIAGFEHALARASRHRSVRVVLAHAGGNDFGLRRQCCARLGELGLENVWLDLTGLGMPLLTRKLIGRLGFERFLFGSDYPLGHPRVQIAHMTAMGLPENETAAILGGNAEKLFGSPSNGSSR